MGVNVVSRLDTVRRTYHGYCFCTVWTAVSWITPSRNLVRTLGQALVSGWYSACTMTVFGKTDLYC